MQSHLAALNVQLCASYLANKEFARSLLAAVETFRTEVAASAAASQKIVQDNHAELLPIQVSADGHLADIYNTVKSTDDSVARIESGLNSGFDRAHDDSGLIVKELEDANSTLEEILVTGILP